MPRHQSRLITSFFLVCILGSASRVQAELPGAVSIGGAYIGLINTFHTDNTTSVDPEREQFDFAANIDFNWKLQRNASIALQLQGGTGGGSLGFQGPDPVVTDLNLRFDFDNPQLVVTFGSFDKPFGEQTESLTNNADSFRNPFLLNSLFYSSFGGTVGTLNTLGAMATLSTEIADITLALTNGTSEGAENPDGNFSWVVSVGTSAGFDATRIAASFMQSGDLTNAGLSTDVNNESFGVDFQGWIVDGSYAFTENAHLKGYFGGLVFNDGLSATEDQVKIWMGEAAYGQGRWRFAVRLSGWNPKDDNGDGLLTAPLPNPGLSAGWPSTDTVGNTTTTSEPEVDQNVVRLQLGFSWLLTEDLTAKLEYVQDDYDRTNTDRLGDVKGAILLLNGRF